jgi:hypothetical protein
MKINEIALLSRVRKKGGNSENLANQGDRISRDKEYLLGKRIGRLEAGMDLYLDYFEGEYRFYVFDTETRLNTLTIFGTKYPKNNKSLIISGVYASRGNRIKASDLYHYIVVKLGYTLVSDRLQSPGGQRVWQDLERRYHQSVEVYGLDDNTGQVVNISSLDDTETHVPADQLDKDSTRDDRYIARNIRLVATAK